MKLIFVGEENQYIAGVPRRDLSGEEFQKLSPEMQKKVLDCKLWKIDKEKKVVEEKENA